MRAEIEVTIREQEKGRRRLEEYARTFAQRKNKNKESKKEEN